MPLPDLFPEPAAVPESHRFKHLAKAAGVILTVGGILVGGVVAEPYQRLTFSAETGIPVCSPSESGDQCAIDDGVIDLNLATKAAQPLPRAVITDEKSVTTVIAYGKSAQNPKSTDPAMFIGSGYVAKNDNGENVTITAAHEVDGSGEPDDIDHPSFNVITNVGDKRRVDPVISARAPRDFSSENGIVSPKSTDLAELVIPSNGWTDNIYTHNGSGIRDSSNDFAGLRPITLQEQKLPLGTIVYDEGVREPNGNIMVAPHAPVVEPMVIAAYLKDNRVVLVSPDPRSPQQWDGDSGSAIVAGNGNAVATEIQSYMIPYDQFVVLTGLKILKASMLSTVKFEVGTLNNAITTDAVNSTLPRDEKPTYLP